MYKILLFGKRNLAMSVAEFREKYLAVRRLVACRGLYGATLGTSMGAQSTADLATRGIVNPGVGRMSVLGRLAQPDEMAKMALFLASDESSFATGAPFINDGGWTSISGLELNVQ